MTFTDEIRQKIWRTYGELPIAFISNKGQIHQNAHYYTQRSGLGIYFTPQEVLITFLEKSSSGNQRKTFGNSYQDEESLKMEQGRRGMCLALCFINGNPAVRLEGKEEGSGNVNYLKGNDPEKWITNLPMYHEVVYSELWPGIDLIFRGGSGQLKYEFVVRPGAEIENIQLTYRGGTDLSLDDRGNLQIHTENGVLHDEKPVSYQKINGHQVHVDSSFVIVEEKSGDKHFRFKIGDNFNSLYPLIIDPGLVYSTYLGGISDDAGVGIAVDTAGNAYVTGVTSSLDFPTSPGAFQTTSDGYQDAFVTKLNQIGSALVYSTILGGTQNSDQGISIAVDATGNAYVTGSTLSPDFPTTPGAFDTTFKGGSLGQDAFVTKLNSTGSALLYSTFLSGTEDDEGIDIVVDAAGNAYVTGNTTSLDFPTTSGAFKTSHNGGFYDGFVIKLNPAGSALVYSTYLGGTGFDQATGIAVDPTGNAYITGFTDSMDYPTTSGAFDRTYNGDPFDAFVTKLNPTGSTLVYSTYLGGELSDQGNGISVDVAGNAYVTGLTTSRNFPTTAGAFDTTFNGGPFDAFVTKLSSTGSALVYSTYLGGTRDDQGADIYVDAEGNAYVTGFTQSTDFPTTSGAYDTTFNGGSDTFVTKLNPTGSAPLLYSTYLGGNTSEQAFAIAVDAEGNAYVTGFTISEDYPTTSGAFDTSYNGFSDAFVAKISTVPTTTPTPIANVNPRSVNFGNQPVNTSSSPQTVTVTNTGTADLIISNVSIAGANPTDFQVFSNMCTIVSPGNSCTIRVTFNPTSTGPRSGTLNIFDNASDSPQQVLLNGNGLPSADLMITKNAFAVPAGSNRKQITYTISVLNLGPNTARNVEVTDRLQSNTTFVSANTSQGTFTAPRRGRSGTVVFNLGNISAGSSATMTIVVMAGVNTFVTNTATVRSSTFDPGPHPNSASVIITSASGNF